MNIYNHLYNMPFPLKYRLRYALDCWRAKLIPKKYKYLMSLYVSND